MARKVQLAAGVLPVARSTGRMLVGLRSQLSREPWTWAAFGGAMEPVDATLADTALRELIEETGYTGPITLSPGKNVAHKNTEGHIFIGIVPREFRPTLNWEHMSAKWVHIEKLDQRAIHWSLAQLFTEP